MGTFDMAKVQGILNSKTPVLDALGVKFGLPTCLLDMTKEALNAFPSPLLNSMHSSLQGGKDRADEVFKDITRSMFLDTGIIEYDTSLGRFVFVSSSSNKGVEADQMQDLLNLKGFADIIGFGSQAWLIGQGLKQQLAGIKTCIEKITSFNALQKGPSVLASEFVNSNLIGTAPIPPSQAASLVYDQNKEQLENAVNFSVSCTNSMVAIEEITKCRLEDPAKCPEPCFYGDLKDSPTGPTLADLTASTTFCVLTDLKKDSKGRPIVPTEDEFDPYTDVITATGLMPPVSKAGQFLFSKTGIYYDSYGGGLELPDGCITNIVSAVYFDNAGVPIPGTGVPANAMRWLGDYNPNLGGKGTCLTLKDFNVWAETVFDIDTIKEDDGIRRFYNEDHFLQVLIDQRNREVYDLSGHITGLIEGGYTEDSALVVNQKQTLQASISTHQSKINRRKKQIEVHVVLSDEKPTLGEIPINDFKDLDQKKIAIQKKLQTNLMFDTNEVSGIVLPLCPNYIKSEIAQDMFDLQDLMVPPVGRGAIITTASSVTSLSGTLLSLTDQVETSRLAAIYNFMDIDLVPPDSEKFLSINCATDSASEGAAQLVASSMGGMFPSGVGVPYFRGVCDLFSGIDGNSKKDFQISPVFSASPYRPYGYGRIEGGVDKIDSLFYKEAGCTIETWCCVPDLDDEDSLGWNKNTELSALHRVILGCENRGGSFSSTNDEWIIGPQHDGVVRGMLMGFSRDRRLAQEGGIAPSNDPNKNKLADGLVFYMAPTQSINTSGVTFLAASANQSFCVEGGSAGSGFYGITMDCSTTSGTKLGKFGDVSSGFKLLTLTINYGGDVVSLYLNGDLMKTQNIFDTFGAEGPPRLPSLVDASSFSYRNSYKKFLPWLPPPWPGRGPGQTVGQTDFWYWDGPEPQGGMTPFIIGGGYTDGMMPNDIRGKLLTGLIDTEGMNFMGGKWGGKKSGLYGFLGSLKLYNKPLSAAEVSKNYVGQKGFFENIQV